jgi:hypothetical protein
VLTHLPTACVAVRIDGISGVCQMTKLAVVRTLLLGERPQRK